MSREPELSLIGFVRFELCNRFEEAYEREVENLRTSYAPIYKDHLAWALFTSRAVGTLVALLEPRIRRTLDADAALSERMHVLAQRWRDAARRVNQPDSPSIYVDCAEELEAELAGGDD